jgi:hypothetical protein
MAPFARFPLPFLSLDRRIIWGFVLCAVALSHLSCLRAFVPSCPNHFHLDAALFRWANHFHLDAALFRWANHFHLDAI